MGHQRFAELVARSDAEVRVKPVDIGRVFAVSGGLPLAQRPKQRQSYRLIELARFAKYLDMPLNLHPKFFPVAGNAAALRIIAATQTVGDAAALQLAGAMMRAVWAEERNIADEGTLDAIAAERGLDAGALRNVAASAASQERYDANTEEAIAEEVFGSPTYIPRFGPAEGQRFWGQDRLDQLARAIDVADSRG
ncbi:MAG: 2-hydroxychromene-2-carboxylate isomerase [Burkholderiaceae bacterium]